jgi:microcystin-dependent protein
LLNNNFMKTLFAFKTIVLLLLLVSIASVSKAQDERGFSFQGYARDISGAALSAADVVVKFSINTEGGTNVFEEEHTLKTDPYGVFIATIGSVQSDDFAGVDFISQKLFLKVETKEVGGTFFEISNAELLSVPYAKVAENVVNGVPAGSLMPFAGPAGKVPDGYLVCDGRSVAVADYPALYEAIGDAWGGDGGTNFRLPDLQGRFLRGANNGTGNDPDASGRTSLYTGGNTGDNVGTYQTGEVGPHNHPAGSLSTNTAGSHSHNVTVDRATGVGGGSSGGDAVWQNDDAGGSYTRSTQSAGNHSHTVTGSTGNSTGSETRPINAAVTYIIKY